MKHKIDYTIYGCILAVAFMAAGCMEEALPTDQATPEQLTEASSIEYLTNSLPSFLITWDTYSSDSHNTNDWGYPCFMFMREACGEDFPCYDQGYNYWSYLENTQALLYLYYYPFTYYYALAKLANNVIAAAETADLDENATARGCLGVGYGYRALAYLDVSRLYEYKETGVQSLDAEAESKGIMGLTVPIVTGDMSRIELADNPSVPFYTMYRFIMDDLNKAETYLDGYTRPDKSFMDQSVIYGLKTRLYLEMATRFENSPEDLTAQLAAEGSEDGYGSIGVTSAADCWAKAAEYAQKAISYGGYSPLTYDQWSDPTTGFNTAQPSWMFGTLVTTKEQINSSYYWNNFFSEIASEASWGMMEYGNYRMIGAELYSEIGAGDWRKYSWVNPDDAGKTTVPDGYRTNLTGAGWAKLPAYTNLKFRPGGGSLTDKETGMIASLPLMRVEEMYFDYFEAIAHTQGVGAAASALQDFVNTYRYTDGSYTCTASDMDSFIEALMIQRRIEFWGEGINMFDYKRLALQVHRAYDGTNYFEDQRINSITGYVAPWLNFVIPEVEKSSNPSIINGPDPSSAISAQ